jgi:hypothetical protein
MLITELKCALLAVKANWCVFFADSKNSFKFCERCLSERCEIQIHQTIRELAVQLPTANNALHSEAGFYCLLERDKGLRGLQGKKRM